MQKVRVPINSFQFGEVSDSLISRNDTPILNSSAQRVENFLVMSEGSLKKRHGLKHIYDYSLTYDASNPNKSFLASFLFDDNEQYILSIEHQKLRAFRLLDDGSVSLVDTVTADVNSAALPFDQDYVTQYTVAQYGDVMFVCHPLFAPRLVSRTSLTNFDISTFSFDSRPDNHKIYQPYYDFQAQGVLLDPRATTGDSILVKAYTSTGTTDASSVAVSQTVSASGSFTLLNSSPIVFDKPRQITFTSTSTNTSKYIQIAGKDIDGVTISVSVTAPSNATVDTIRFFKEITYIATSTGAADVSVGFNSKEGVSYFNTDGSQTGGNYLSSAHVGTVLRYHESEMTITEVQSSCEAIVDIVDELKIRLAVLNPLRTIEGSASVEVTHLSHGFSGGEAITVEEAAATGGINTGNLNGSRTVGNIINENTYTFTAGGSASSSEDGGGYVKIVTHAATADWYEQAFSAVRGYPASVCFHENRLVFGGTIAQPDTIWMSKIGQFFNFDVGEAEDSDSIDLTAATGQVNEIRYMVSNRDLQVFTASGELYIPTYLNQAITPTNAQIRKQTPYGTEFVLPASIDGATVFVQHDGHTVREYLYTDSEDAYTASSISTLSGHLIQSPQSMAVVHSGFDLSDSYAFIVLGDGEGTLFSSNRAEKRASWTRVTTSGRFAGTIAIHNRLFVNVYDKSNKLHLCEFTGDVGLDLYLYEAVSTNVVDVSGLYNNNDVVDVIGVKAGKQSYLGQLTVNSSEEINLSAYSEHGFTHAYVGKAFTAKIVTNPIDVTASNGPVTGTIRGISNVVLDLKATRSVKVNNRNFSMDDDFSGKKEIRILGHSRDPQITIEQNDPLQLQLNGLIAELVL